MAKPANLGQGGVRWLVTLLAAAFLLAHLAWPDLRIDAITVTLLVILILPWLSPLLQSIELPGGAKITFRDVKDAAEKIAPEGAPDPAALAAAEEAEDSAAAGLESIAESDPGLALVALRIDIEKRLRTLAARHGLSESRSLTRLLRQLMQRKVLTGPAADGLADLIVLGNQAAHGATVSAGAAEWAILSAPRVLSVLDAKLAE